MKPNGRPFTWRDAVAMFDEMVLWLAEHQVAGGHPHVWAVYFPTEDRFCNRDTACMARASSPSFEKSDARIEGAMIVMA